jgi:O-antigen/teichoic acid export membrane protein
MRTASNFMKQIFSAFTNSIKIEFIDYINEKNEKYFLNTYLSLYFILSLIIIPFAFFFQIIAPTIFEIWTRDKIIFDPILFGSMTISFLIMIFYNPATMIISGKNLYKKDLLISIFTSIIFILLLIFLLKTFSMRGAGYSLVILEIISCFLTFYFANKWLRKEFINFNLQIILFSLIDLVISSIFIYILITDMVNIKYIIFVFTTFKLIYGLLFLKLMPTTIKRKILILKKYF